LAIDHPERRLAAVLAADVAGYSRLMGVNEEGTLARLKAFRKGLFDPAIASHRGRIVKTTGDGILAEFASAVDAVRCAVEVQSGTAEQNATEPQDQRLEFRIGIHVGDIMVDDNDIFGDGVNIAARLEGIAEPGGVCVSDDAYRQVRGKVDVGFDDMGPQPLKNIVEPMQAWKVRLIGQIPSAIEPVSTVIQSQQLSLPDKPSIAVLPFQNMSGDPEQEYFADGIVEEILTALARFKSLFVIARNSSFTYKGKAIDIKQVGRELGVRYVLEGSVRKASATVRITGQLIDAETGHHIWADRFDGSLEDVFDLQDRVTESVVGAIEPSITLAEINRGRSKPTESLDAYDCYLRALLPSYQFTRDGNDTAMKWLRHAIDLDPDYAMAKAFLANVLLSRAFQGWSSPADREWAIQLAQESIIADHDNPLVLRSAGLVLVYFAEAYDQALTIVDRAVALNPNSAPVLASSAWVYCFGCSNLDKAIDYFDRAIRLSPLDPEMAITLSGLAAANLILNRNEEALRVARLAIRESPNLTTPYRCEIIALMRLGHTSEARRNADHVLVLDPNFSAAQLGKLRDSVIQESFYSSLRAAGLPA
jgi:TolB-like protein/class 3 adenylate cyclase